MHLWAGIDAGKAHHHCVVIDADGNRLLSQKIPNDEPALLQLLAGVLELAGGDPVVWATDLNHVGPGLLIAMLVAHGQTLLYIPGRTVHHASNLYRGDGKTDAKDAFVIADQARMRRDLQPLRAAAPDRTPGRQIRGPGPGDQPAAGPTARIPWRHRRGPHSLRVRGPVRRRRRTRPRPQGLRQDHE
ncbi:hypothetical protein NicSoilB8_03140 [Arthrobacter sp. NicSoilB8]|nr:hypothetical protein NicSoilB8_03140 [Arthrobacter sp. NicSoilB8]